MPDWKVALTAALTALALAGCTASPGPAEERHDGEPVRATTSPVPARAASSEQRGRSDESETPGAEPTTAAETRLRLASDGSARRSALTIPEIAVRRLAVVPYRGKPDDAPGTNIQDGGVAASPHGPRGGAGPGGIGNYIVTAHRTSSTRAFAELPKLRRGDRVHVDAGGSRYTYRIVGTRTTSFRSGRSLARQSAAVPGHPGRRPTRAMITLSTCATPEDHAQGNYWSDEFGNPEHRIDKIGALVLVRPLRSPAS